MALLRYANLSYFSDGIWEEDLDQNREPILIDPQWENTSLGKSLSDFPPETKSRKNFFWLATSGSTGIPKLVEKHRDQLERELETWKRQTEDSFWDFKEDTDWIVTVPLCHLYGLIWGRFLPKQLHKTIHYTRDVLEIQNIGSKNYRKTVLISNPDFIGNLIQAGTSLPFKIISSGSKFPVHLSRILRDEGKVELREIYGSTETGAIGFRNPLWKARFLILPEVKTKTIPKEDGEILSIRSPFLSETAKDWKGNRETNQGEWENHSLVGQDGFFSTNDWGDLSNLGWNYIGRTDRITKVKGKRISLDLTESLLSSTNFTKEIAVDSVEAEKEENILVCMIVLKKEKTLADFMEIINQELPKSFLPHLILEQNQIPKLPNGKTDYIQVRSILKNYNTT